MGRTTTQNSQNARIRRNTLKITSIDTASIVQGYTGPVNIGTVTLTFTNGILTNVSDRSIPVGSISSAPNYPAQAFNNYTTTLQGISLGHA